MKPLLDFGNGQIEQLPGRARATRFALFPGQVTSAQRVDEEIPGGADADRIALRRRASEACLTGVPQRDSCGENQAEDCDSDERRRDAVMEHETLERIRERFVSCEYGPPLEMTTQVVRELGSRTIATCGLALQRESDDRVEVAAQAARFDRCIDTRLRDAARRRRLRTKLALDHQGQRGPRSMPGPLAAEQLEQQQAQRIHVRRRRHRLPRKLFRRCVGQRHRSLYTPLLQAVVAQKRSHADIQELALSFGRNQHFFRLDITMHEQVAVRIRSRFAEMQEQLQSLRQWGAARAAPLRQREAFDPLDDDERPAIACDTCVDQPRDARMIEPREHPLLLIKAVGRFHRLVRDQPEHGLRMSRAVGALGVVQLARSVSGDQGAESPSTDLCIGRSALRRCSAVRSHWLRVLGGVVGHAGLLDQPIHVASKPFVRARALLQPRSALRGRLRHRLVEQSLDPRPGFGAHPRVQLELSHDGITTADSVVGPARRASLSLLCRATLRVSSVSPPLGTRKRRSKPLRTKPDTSVTIRSPEEARDGCLTP
nr:hypothetical protein [Panacagrimonas perspica]